MSIGELLAEVRRREQNQSKLQKKREKLISQLAEIDAQLAGSGSVVRSRRGRASNGMTLEDTLVKVLSGRTMGVSEAADAVRQAGYHSSAANFRTIVNQTLLRSERIKKVARGSYTAA